MDSEIQQNLEPLHAHEMLKELKTLFAQQAEQELLQTTRDFRSCKQEKGHMGKTVNELHALLKLHEQTLNLPKSNAPALRAIQAGKVQKEIVLNNCHYAPSITRGVIFVSRLYEDGFVNRFVDNTIQVSRNNVVYFSAVPRDGIFEIDLSNSLTNESSVYAVSNKRAKLDLDSALLWHCRLGHINKKRIEKLLHDGLLNSSDLTAFEKCVSCMSRKMARKPYMHQLERAKDLLRLIHTDVCGPFKIIVSKRSRKSTRKTIKSLRSDHGGEYMSQEFLDHLKDHGIIAHRTPPYTSQLNGVSERRNRTLLDMVRSMMSQTTLPKSFWDYALETAARILNMVPTKKVEKTPYKVWHGKAPKIPKENMGYSFYYPPENKVIVARNAEFLENNLIEQEESGSLEDIEIIQEEDTHPSLDTSLNHEEDDLKIDEP
uniref:Integrase catalytic domain-containing protein n=1 Tax=Tanacetum cinerariifolium TaxID=118510 RepID=A0A6L2KQL1_TANCI|nr:hypothetical protein [Tanacetum cinerariifolium]